MTMTLGEAQTTVRKTFLDDDGSRWDDTEANIAINSAISSTLSEIARNNIRHFAEVEDVTTNADGLATLSTKPIRINHVHANVGGLWVGLLRSGRNLSHKNCEAVETLRVDYYPRHVKIGSIGTPLHPKSWGTFDLLVCTRAAIILKMKDEENPAFLRAQESELKNEFFANDVPSPMMSRQSDCFSAGKRYKALFLENLALGELQLIQNVYT